MKILVNLKVNAFFKDKKQQLQGQIKFNAYNSKIKVKVKNLLHFIYSISKIYHKFIVKYYFLYYQILQNKVKKQLVKDYILAIQKASHLLFRCIMSNTFNPKLKILKSLPNNSQPLSGKIVDKLSKHIIDYLYLNFLQLKPISIMTLNFKYFPFDRLKRVETSKIMQIYNLFHIWSDETIFDHTKKIYKCSKNSYYILRSVYNKFDSDQNEFQIMQINNDGGRISRK